MDLKTRQWQDALTTFQTSQQMTVEAQQQKWSELWNTFLSSRVGIALICSLISFALLCLLQPPMVRKKTKDHWVSGDLDPSKVLIWTALIFGVTLFIPQILNEE
jgi:hypothetical protein